MGSVRSPTSIYLLWANILGPGPLQLPVPTSYGHILRIYSNTPSQATGSWSLSSKHSFPVYFCTHAEAGPWCDNLPDYQVQVSRLNQIASEPLCILTNLFACHILLTFLESWYWSSIPMRRYCQRSLGFWVVDVSSPPKLSSVVVLLCSLSRQMLLLFLLQMT